MVIFREKSVPVSTISNDIVKQINKIVFRNDNEKVGLSWSLMTRQIWWLTYFLQNKQF